MQGQMTDINLIDTFERIPVTIFKDLKEGSAFAADVIASLIKEKQSQKKCASWVLLQALHRKPYMQN